jgi:MraZ protein
MFLGTYRPTLISKARLTLPKKIRKELKGKSLVLTIGFEKCIFGFERKQWEKIIEPELLRPLFSDAEGRNLRRKMCAEAFTVKLGAQGRFIIPERMMKYASISGKIILIGAGDHFEIWARDQWEKYAKEIENG